MTYSSFWLRRFRVISNGVAVYDNEFTQGVNIIRGENGSGKSTLADFIFYGLGGAFENWKTAAARCDQVQAEVVTKGGVLTLRRDVGKAQTPMQVFFGPMTEAQAHGLDDWHRYPMKRQDNSESFSQIMFRASGIPEAQSQGAANITMHQILRLLYADQKTPSGFLFRYESFDTAEIREAVGDLVCGLSVYELYEIDLKLRDLNKQFDEKARKLSGLIEGLPDDEKIASVEAIDERLKALDQEYERKMDEISRADELIDDNQVKRFLQARRDAVNELKKLRQKISEYEQALYVYDLEISDLEKYTEHLQELSDKIPKVKEASSIVGHIEFSHCPACLSELKGDRGAGHCVLCGAETDPEHEQSRYLQIKLDLDIQIRESKQLIEEKRLSYSHKGRELRQLRRDYESKLSDYSVRYDLSTAPRESFVAGRYQRIGQIGQEKRNLEKLKDRVREVDEVSQQKQAIQDEINRLKDRQKALQQASDKRRRQALTRVANTAKHLLSQDLERQPEFKDAENVSLNFRDNAVLVDGELNFAESSNVIVKNTAILALLFSATEDKQFYHPRFALLDNIEDKGMEQDRSHNFQQLLVRASRKTTLDHQIIVTTSMFDPTLEDEGIVVGPSYTHDNRVLDFDVAGKS